MRGSAIAMLSEAAVDAKATRTKGIILQPGRLETMDMIVMSKFGGCCST